MTDRKPASGLSARAASIGYGGAPIVEGLDLAIPPGRFTALLGPNGCGKSTILRALSRLLAPASGDILLDGARLAALGSKQAARRIGLLAQGAESPEGLSVVELVRQGRYPHRAVFARWTAEDEAAVDEALALTGMGGLREASLDTLSGGQRQRAWIAMTLAQRTEILLLDEPTTYLDLAHQVEILGLMRQIVDTGGKTVVAVLHDLNQAARHADHVVMLKAGRIVAEGDVGATLNPDTIAAVFGVDCTVFTDPESGRPFCIPRSVRDGDG